MLRKLFLFLAAGLLVWAFVGCTEDGPIDGSTTGYTSSEIPQPTSDLPKETENNRMNNCSLIINGAEVSSKYHAWIDSDTGRVEVPVLKISAELGAKITWIDSNVVEISYMGKTECIDTLEEGFGIPLPPGAVGSVRQVIDEEIIIDLISIKGLFKNMMDAKISVDYDAGIIYVNSIKE